MLLLGAALTVSACADADSLVWCPPAAEGVEVVAATGAGPWGEGAGPARLEELWRAGGLAEGEELVFPVALAASPEGRLAIPDFRLAEVVVVEPDGRWLGPWGRRGKGPGELATPVAANWGRDGRLAVFDVTAPKVLFLAEGVPSGDDVPVVGSFTAPIVASGELPWAGVQPDGGTLVQPVPQPVSDADPGLREGLLLRLPAGASVPDTLARVTLRTGAEGWALPGWPRLLTAVGSDGSIAIAAADSLYRIVIHDRDARPVRQICRQAEPLPVTDRERGVGAEDLPGELAASIRTAALPATPQPFGRLFWGSRGQLWVQRDRPAPLEDFDALFGPPGALYDVFDDGGQYLGEVQAPPLARLQAAAGDTVYGFEFGDLDEAWVVAYRIIHK